MPEAPLVLTRPAAQAKAWQARLQALGVPSLVLPLVAVTPDSAQQEPARQAVAQADAVFFTSPAAVQALFGADAWPWPHPVQALCVGPGTQEALRARGVLDIVAPPSDATQFDSEALWPLLEQRDWQQRRLLWLRGDGGREWLIERLRQQGAQLQVLTVYHRSRPQLAAEPLAEALRGPALWLFSSSEAVENLAAAVQHLHERGLQALATHPRIAETATRHGLRVRLVRPQLSDLAEAWSLWRTGWQHPAP